MVVGFNHNFSYKGQVYHVQTEDSGVKNPHIITLLYRGGTILASKKTSYADIIKVNNLDAVVEDLMKSQHREMLRLLKNGEFDELLGLPAESPDKTPVEATTAAPPMATQVTPASPPTPPVAAPSTVPPPAPPVRPPVATSPTPPVSPALPSSEKSPEKKPSPPPPTATALSLDDIILSYMVGEDRKK